MISTARAEIWHNVRTQTKKGKDMKLNFYFFTIELKRPVNIYKALVKKYGKHAVNLALKYYDGPHTQEDFEIAVFRAKDNYATFVTSLKEDDSLVSKFRHDEVLRDSMSKNQELNTLRARNKGYYEEMKDLENAVLVAQEENVANIALIEQLTEKLKEANDALKSITNEA